MLAASDEPARAILEQLAGFLPPVRLDAGSGSNLPHMIFLKEFPEISGGYEACYQAVTAGAIRLTDILDWGVLGRSHEVRILECFSHRVVEQLGLETRERRMVDGRAVDVIEPLLGYWMQWRGVVDPGRVIWRPPPPRST